MEIACGCDFSLLLSLDDPQSYQCCSMNSLEMRLTELPVPFYYVGVHSNYFICFHVAIFLSIRVVMQDTEMLVA